MTTKKEIVERFNRWTPDEPVMCSQGGIPFNKVHLDAKDAEIERLRTEIERLRDALGRIIDLDHHNHGPESQATKIARDARIGR